MRLLVFALLLMSCAEPPRDRETARVRSHLENMYRELQSTPMTPARARVLADLRRYIEAEDYPINDTSIPYTPIFVDDHGARCAMAALIEASGELELVARIARDHKYAYIRELAGDPELGRWLADHDLTLDEAARIQPGYSNTVEHSLHPTASLILSGGLASVDGEPEVVGGIGARIGVRRISETTDACDHCVHRSSALMAEYKRIGGDGGFNQLGLLLSYELDDNGDDHQFYVLGGGLVALDGNDTPGSGFGGQLGVGFSLRNRKQPLLFEGSLQVLDLDRGATVRGGIDVGVVW
jgi:hypothetical protein